MTEEILTRLEKEITDIKSKLEKLENEVNIVKYDNGILKTEGKHTIDILKEIKESLISGNTKTDANLLKVTNKMEEIEARPNKLLQNVMAGVTIAIIMLIIGLLLRFKGIS